MSGLKCMFVKDVLSDIIIKIRNPVSNKTVNLWKSKKKFFWKSISSDVEGHLSLTK